MEWYNVLTLLFGSGVISSLIAYIFKRIRANDCKTESVQLGVQALLRDRLIHEYNKAIDRGYAPIYAKENFDNMWTQYHNLGKNGVMDGIHEEYMSLPTKPEE